MNPQDNNNQENWWGQKKNWEKEYKLLIQGLEDVFDFQYWKFQPAFARIEDEYGPPYVIYNSEWCRVWFGLKGGDLHQAYEMSVYYGRLHAPDDGGFLIWNGEKCTAWHDVRATLYFLDGLSPKEAAEKWQVKYELPDVIEKFKKSELGQKVLPGGYQTIEGVARLHLSMWEHYGLHLFELFDLRRPDIWEKLTLFLSEYHKILRTPINRGFPAPDKNC